MKRLTVYIILVLLVTMLGAVGYTEEEPDLRIPIRWYTDKHRARLIADAYNDISEELRLDVVHVTLGDEQVLLDALAAGDVDLMDLTFFHDLVVDSGYAMNLDPLVQRDPDWRTRRPYLDAMRDPRGQFVVPLGRIPVTMFAHEDILQSAGVSAPAPGWTWEDFIQLTIDLTDTKNDTYGVVNSYLLLWQLPFHQLGGDVFSSPYDDLYGGLQLVGDLLNVHKSHVPRSGPLAFWPMDSFVNKQAAIVIADSSMVFSLPRDMTDWLPLTLPVPVSGMAPASYGRVDQPIAVAATSRHPLEAWSVIEWLVSPIGADTMLAEAGMLPLFAYPESVALATQLYGPAASGFFVEPFIAIQDDRSFRDPAKMSLLTALLDVADAYLVGGQSMDSVIQLAEQSRAEYGRTR